MKRKMFSSIFAAVIFSLAFCPSLKAQEASDKDAAKKLADDTYRQKLREIISKQPKGEEFKNEVDSYIKYMPMSSLRDQPGKISVIQSATEYSYVFKAFSKIPVELSLNTDYINLNKNDAVPVSLPTTLTEIGAGIQATLPFFGVDKTYLRLGARPSFSGEDWEANSSNFSIPSTTLIIYQPNDKLTLIAGVLVTPSSGRKVTGIGGLIYNPTDKLSFNLIPPRPTISYQVCKAVSLFLEGSIFNNQYKVSKDGFKGKSLVYNEWDIGGGINIIVNKDVDVSFSAGNMFNRYLKYSDSLGKADIKNGPYVECRVEITF